MQPAANQLALLDDLPEHTAAKKTGYSLLRERDNLIALPPRYVMVQTDEQLADCVEQIQTSGIIAVDTEHRSKNNWLAKKAVALSIYTPSNKKSYFIPNRMQQAYRNFSDDEIQEALQDVFYDTNIRKVGHNFKGDIHFLRETYNLFVRGFYHDTLTASVVLNENEPHDLEALSVKYLKSGSWKLPFTTPAEVWPIKLATFYACKDAEMTYKLYEFQRSHLDKPQLQRLARLLYDLEMPVLDIVGDMEKRGVGWDEAYYESTMKPTIRNEREAAAQRIYEHTGPINLEAPQQVATALFDTLGLPRINEDHTDKKVLEPLARQGYTIASDILDYRQYATIDKMFVTQLPNYVVNGRIHCTFNTIGAETGRMSAQDPNLMQIPKRIGPIIRRGFIPSPGKVLVAFDFNQAELRMLAHFSGDPTLIAAFAAGQDAHTAVMCGMLHIDYAAYEANPDLPLYVAARVKAKAVNFGTLYGQGASALAEALGIPLEEATEFIRAYYRKHPLVKKFIDKTHADCFDCGYVETIMGRKRRLPGIRSKDRMVSSGCERESVNAKIQGSVADLAKKAMIDHRDLLARERWPFDALLQIHDELIYEVERVWLMKNMYALNEMNRVMSETFPLRVPMLVKHEVLTRWGDKMEAA
jgi:DNA polymerase-1